MASMIVRELSTIWKVRADSKDVDKMNKQIDQTKRKADTTGDGLTNMFERPRDAAGKFLKYKPDSLFGGGSKILGDAATSLNLIKESAASARNDVLKLMGAFALGGVGLGGVFKIMSDMEQTEVAFEVMIGDAKKAQKTLNDLKNFAKTTPFSFADTSDLSKRLLAFSFQAEELIPIMTSLGNIAAGVGKEKLPQLVLALGQVKAAGKLRGSELRQFTEAGVPLIHELAKTLGVADKQVQEMVENGKVGFDQVWKSLQNVTGEGGRFNNLMARQSQTLGGMVSNVIDTIQLLIVDLGKKGLLGRAKEFVSGFLAMLESNREAILDNMVKAIELVISAMEKIIWVAKGVWQVFRGLTSVFGGTQKALMLVVKGMFLLVSARMLFLLGKMGIGIAGLARSWMMAGNAALWAQIKMAAIPIAIGAGIAILALAIEDIIGYFQGRKSVTGLILDNLEGIGAKFEAFLGPILDKVKAFAQNVGKWIMEGIAAMTDGDWSKIGSGILAALELAGILTTVPLRIGIAIADGLSSGLLEGLQKKFPKLAEFLGLSDVGSILPSPGKADFADHEVGLAEGLGSIWKLVTGVRTISPNTSLGAAPLKPLAAPAAGGNGGVSINSPITITTPAGTTPEQVGPFVRQGVRDSLDTQIREAHRATKPAVDY